MLESAAELFGSRGYHATGLNQLTSAGGAPKGSLYFHFPGGKEQLAVEAVQLSGERLREGLQGILAAHRSPGEAVAAVAGALGENLRGSGFEHGCPLATIALDAGGNKQIRQACAQSYAGWLESIEGQLTASGLPAQRAAELATVVLTSIEGALLLAKTNHDLTPLHTVGAHLRAVLDEETRACESTT